MIAMNVNDLLCVGVESIVLVDYLAVREPHERVFEEIAKGLYEGAKQAGIAIVGGDRVMPDLINGLDLAGTAIGIAEKGNVITGEGIRPGDAVLGIASFGIHSNGLTLARKLLIPKYGLDYGYEGKKL